MSTVTDKDKGYAALFARLGAAKRAFVTVGVHGPEGSETHQGTELTVVDVATIHEYGLGNCPARSFIRAYADESKAANEKRLAVVARNHISGTIPIDQGLDRLGLKMVAEIQNRIVAHIAPPLKPETIDRKGSSTPLVDTGQLKSSIRHEIGGLPFAVRAARAGRAAIAQGKDAAKRGSRIAKRAAKDAAKTTKRVIKRAPKQFKRAGIRTGKQLTRASKKLTRAGKQFKRASIRTGKRISRILKKRRK